MIISSNGCICRIRWASPLGTLLFTAVLGLGVISDGHAFKPKIDGGHFEFTRTEVVDIERFSDTGKSLKFTEDSIMQLQKRNIQVDRSASFFNERLHCDNELLPDCTQVLIDTKERIDRLFESDTNATPKGAGSRSLIGRALHTLQDFYAHSNWVDLSGTAPNPGLGDMTEPALAEEFQTCDTATGSQLEFLGLTDLTTGHFSINPLNPHPAPDGKCNHGFGLAEGINKDDSSRGVGWVNAKAAAEASSKQYVELILDQPNIAGNDIAIRAIMGLGSSIAFAIDDTGSMGPEIAGVQAIVQDTIAEVTADPDSAPQVYILVRFGDPDKGDAKFFDNPQDLLTAVNAIVPSGGGDCPEFSVAGTLEAIGKSEIGGQVVVFSDATAKDSDDGTSVANAAAKRKVQVDYMLSGSCSPIDPAYIEIAQQSGGQVFLVDDSEIANSFPLIQPGLSGDSANAITAVVNPNGTPIEYDLPIGSTDEALNVSASFQGVGSLELVRPDSLVVEATDPGVTITTLSSGQFIRVETPEPGPWRIRIDGTDEIFLNAKINGSISIRDFEFVELKGRPAHEGLFAIDGQPAGPGPYIAISGIAGAVTGVAFEFRSIEGVPIQTIELAQGLIPDAGDDLFSGEITTLPPEPFRVYMTATNNQGEPVLRAFPPIFQPQTIAVLSAASVRELIPGSTVIASFEVTNFGDSGTFNLSAIDDFELVTLVSPSSVNLNTGETQMIEVTLQTPLDIEAIEGLLSVTATNAFDPDVTNSAVVSLFFEEEMLLTGIAGFQPNTLNRGSNGQFVNVHIEAPEGFDSGNIDIDTVQLTAVDGSGITPLAALSQGNSLGDFNKNGIIDLKVKFDRSDFLDLVEDGTHEVVFRAVVDGQPFASMRGVTIMSN